MTGREPPLVERNLLEGVEQDGLPDASQSRDEEALLRTPVVKASEKQSVLLELGFASAQGGRRSPCAGGIRVPRRIHKDLLE